MTQEQVTKQQLEIILLALEYQYNNYIRQLKADVSHIMSVDPQFLSELLKITEDRQRKELALIINRINM